MAEVGASTNTKHLSDDDEYPDLHKLPQKVLTRVAALDELEAERCQLSKKFLEERKLLVDRNNKVLQEHYNERYQIVSGSVEDERADDTNLDGEQDKGIPNFWLYAMTKHNPLSTLITERDYAILKFLKEVKYCMSRGGYNLEFVFDKNNFFKNSVLTRTIEGIGDSWPTIVRTTGTEIEWISGKTEDCESFFKFFDPKTVKSMLQQYVKLSNNLINDFIPIAGKFFTSMVDDISSGKHIDPASVSLNPSMSQPQADPEDMARRKGKRKRST